MKKTSWSELKQLIGKDHCTEDLFLTLIEPDGRITCANSRMIRDMELRHPSEAETNFFDLIHPSHRNDLRNALQSPGQDQPSLELHLKNGHYHPMKWQINSLGNNNNIDRFLCVGYKIVDDKRINRFHELLKNHGELIAEGPHGLLFHDNRGEMIAANQMVASIFGTTLEYLYQLKDIEEQWNNEWLIRNEDGHRLLFRETPFMKAIATGESYTETLVIRLKSGETKWVVFNSQPCQPMEGEQLSAVSHLVDITAERKLSEELRAGKALNAAFFEQTPTLSWVIDETTALQIASQAFYDHFSLIEKECIGAKITDIVPPSVASALYNIHLKVFETGKPIQTTEKIKWADGSHTISHIHLFPIQSGSGKKLLGGQAINLPDKSRLEKELKDAHQRMLNLSRATSDAIWEWDMQTGQIFRNEALMEMVGYQSDNSRGLSWWLRRIHPEDRDRLADKVKEATENFQQSWQDAYRFKCADGTYKYVEDKGFVVYENGLPVKMIGSLNDISLVKELENELADFRLQKQKEISETVIRMQEKERTRIGHELHDNVNQILSTVKLFFDGVKTSSEDQKQLKEKSIEYLLMAIEEIRKLSKELVTPQLKQETLTDTILAVITDIQITGAIKINFTHQVDESLISQGKKITLFRIIQEQLKNILKHSGATTADIRLHTNIEAVELVISDNGKGFDPHQTRQGIGLANIHERTQFYNGTVNINATGGKGCSLQVSIPLDNQA